MIIKPSTALRNDYGTISELARKEPVFITKNGEGDLVVMSIELYERLEEQFRLRSTIYAAEQFRVDGGRTYSLEEVEKEFGLDEGI